MDFNIALLQVPAEIRKESPEAKNVRHHEKNSLLHLSVTLARGEARGYIKATNWKQSGIDAVAVAEVVRLRRCGKNRSLTTSATLHAI